jgi:PTS system ascorbate-specific IIA component
MIPVVVIAHEPLASALVSVARHVYSRDPNAASRQLSALDVAADAHLPAIIAAAEALVAEVDRGQGVLVLTDMPGATPANVALRLAAPGRVAVASGVNVPMLLRSLCYGELGLDEVLAKALDGATRCVQQLKPAASADDSKPGNDS